MATGVFCWRNGPETGYGHGWAHRLDGSGTPAIACKGLAAWNASRKNLKLGENSPVFGIDSDAMCVYNRSE